MTAIHSFRDLRVWQISMDLVEHVYQVTRGFPKYEIYGLASQMQRAAVSVPSNIAEGHARAHLKEYLHHLAMAQGSLAELQTQIEIAERLEYCTTEHFDTLINMASSLSKQLRALRSSLSR
jgi:four helix bundle protein